MGVIELSGIFMLFRAVPKKQNWIPRIKSTVIGQLLTHSACCWGCRPSFLIAENVIINFPKAWAPQAHPHSQVQEEGILPGEGFILLRKLVWYIGNLHSWNGVQIHLFSESYNALNFLLKIFWGKIFSADFHLGNETLTFFFFFLEWSIQACIH